MPEQTATAPNTQKTFFIGSEWMYYKIYCGVKTADDILLQVIGPICAHLLRENHIDKWFFIRYNDPDAHLRVRFHITSPDAIATIIQLVNDHLDAYRQNLQVWDMQLATYQRELKRYGAHSITHAESVFFYDSEQVLYILAQATNDEERFIHTFHWVEELICLFRLTDVEQIAFLEAMQQQFKEEFQVTKETNKQLNLKYKKLESQLFVASTLKTLHDIPMKAQVSQLLKLKEAQLLSISLDSLLASFIHMTINRTFKSQQRLHEMLIYDLLTKKNKSKIARYGKL